MNRSMHQYVERYVGGKMGFAERQEFEQLLIESEELRHMVETERLIHRALFTDRAAVPATATEPSALLMASLRSTPAQSSAMHVFRSGSTFSLWSFRSLSIALGSMIVIGSLVGLFLAPMLSPTAEHAQPASSRDTVFVPLGQPSVESRINTQVESETKRRESEVREQTPPVRVRAERPTENRSSEATDAVVEPPAQVDATQASEDQALKELIEQQEKTAPVRVKRSDSVEMPLKIEK